MTSDITKVTFDNGLLVLLKEIHTAPIITHWIWYRVGSKDEIGGITGASHWVEHMLFKGTEQFPAGILDKAISRDGGYWNAMTYIDWTTYFATMPADKVDLISRLEADRMTNSLFDIEEIESERTVIISERQGNENSPMFRLDEEVQSAAFRVHSYHHEVIGDMADLESMTREDLYDHYKKYYVPNNAVLTIAGDFNTDEILARLHELYDPIPAGEAPPRLSRPEPPQKGERRVTVEGPGETAFVRAAYHPPANASADFFTLMALDSLLSGASSLNMFGGGISNKTSRLYQSLVEGEIAVGVGGGIGATIDPFLYNITLTVHPDRTLDEALAGLDDEIAKLQDTPPTQAEIKRAVKQARALFAYGSESITNQGFWLGYSEIFDAYEWFTGYLDRLAKVTPKDVQRVAQEYLRPQNRVVGYYLPTGSGGGAA